MIKEHTIQSINCHRKTQMHKIMRFIRVNNTITVEALQTYSSLTRLFQIYYSRQMQFMFWYHRLGQSIQ